MPERLQAALEHPVRLVLERGADLADDLRRQALVFDVDGCFLVVPTVVVAVRYLTLDLNRHLAFTSSPGHAVSPHAAPFSAFNPSRAHLMRAGLIGMLRF